MANDKLTVVTLNAWGGRALYPLMRFLQRQAPTTHVFCLQEIFNTAQEAVEKRHPDEFVCGNLFQRISAELKDFRGSFAAHEGAPDRMSLAMFVRNDVSVRAAAKDFAVYVPEQPVETGSAVLSSRRLQHATFNLSGKGVLVANYHGLWVNGPKTDTPERLQQSEKVKTFLSKQSQTQLLCGDFNLLPKTESVRILAKHMRNLVVEHKVRSTRTPLYRHYNDKAEPNFADYVFTSPDLQVHRFEVLPDIASDHAALLTEVR